MSCDILELEILDEYEQDVQMNLDFGGDILYLLDQSISKDTLTIKHIHLNNGENKDSVLENYINCMGTISGNGEFLQWYESYDAGEFSSATGLTLKAIQYITYLDGNLQGNRFRRLCQYSWGTEDYIWTEWNLQENFYVTNAGEAMNEEHLSSLIKYDNLPYFFTTGAGLVSQIGKGPFVGARSNNIISCTDITNGKIWEINTTQGNQPKQISSIQIDQTYNPESENAQSGIAIAEIMASKMNIQYEYFEALHFNDIDIDTFFNENKYQNQNVVFIIVLSDCFLMFENYRKPDNVDYHITLANLNILTKYKVDQVMQQWHRHTFPKTSTYNSWFSDKIATSLEIKYEYVDSANIDSFDWNTYFNNEEYQKTNSLIYVDIGNTGWYLLENKIDNAFHHRHQVLTLYEKVYDKTTFKITNKWYRYPINIYGNKYMYLDWSEANDFVTKEMVTDISKKSVDDAIGDINTVPEWAKQPEKPTYTAEEVGALSKKDIDQTYSPESENAQSGKAVAEAIADFAEGKVQINYVELSEYTYDKLIEFARQNYIMSFNTRGWVFSGSSTGINLPNGGYLTIYDSANSTLSCWLLRTGELYIVKEQGATQESNYFPTYGVYCKTKELEANFGNIDTALDNIIAIQESLIGGASK